MEERPGKSRAELAQRLGAIRWRLDSVSFGHLKNHEKEVPKLVESLRTATETLVWGEKNDMCMFDLFRENTMLEAFACALRTTVTPSPVKGQVLQSLSILIQNARRPSTIDYFLSAGLLNALFDDPPCLDDEELLAYFVTILKSVALLLSPQTSQLCLVSEHPETQGETPSSSSSIDPLDAKMTMRMPLLERAIFLTGNDDTMVQTAARTSVLAVLRVQQPAVRAVAERDTAGLLAPVLASMVSDGRKTSRGKRSMSADKLEDLFDFIVDLCTVGLPVVKAALEQQGFIFEEVDGRLVISHSAAVISQDEGSPCTATPSSGMFAKAKAGSAEWMFGDAMAGAISTLNPLRWSGARPVEQAVKELQNLSLQDQKRPIILKIPAGVSVPQRTFDCAEDAVEYARTRIQREEAFWLAMLAEHPPTVPKADPSTQPAVNSAMYKSSTNASLCRDVTDVLNRLLAVNGVHNVTQGREMNYIFGDPAPGHRKVLHVRRGKLSLAIGEYSRMWGLTKIIDLSELFPPCLEPASRPRACSSADVRRAMINPHRHEVERVRPAQTVESFLQPASSSA
eukprot:TRINITY_DN46354_c0_g1_i1.p1 TRINITY_DN46354_c0_g1~~TRINITY_DN46354_c0_g1_i1.p1  ORF type:complete len:568 (-),score=73.71 TRINITY_DN46354_c0_g1_i1:31-1734(-)